MIRRYSALLLALFLCCSCDWFGGRGNENNYVVLLYIAGDNSLSVYGDDNIYGDDNSDIKGLVDGYMPSGTDKEKTLLVFYDLGQDEGPRLSRFYRDKDDRVFEEVLVNYPVSLNSSTPESLKTVLADAETSFPATRRGLILWSHGTGFLPEDYTNTAEGKKRMSFGEEDRKEIEIQDLREVLSPYHYDYIIFDCCLMGGVEVAYELKDCADYVAFSQTEIMAEGLQYGTMMDHLFNLSDARSAVIAVSQDYMDYYFSLSKNDQCATWSVVECAALPELAQACRTIFENHRDMIPTLDRKSVQNYYRFSTMWFFDLDDFIGRLADSSEYAAFTTALNKAMVYRNATSHFLSIDISHYCGLSTYIPFSAYPQLNTYYCTLLWNEAAGLVE